MSNNPPFAVLELDEEEAKFLTKWLLISKAETEHDFKDACSMSSSDPRATHRASLVMMLGAEEAMAEDLGERLCSQHKKLTTHKENLTQLIEDRKARAKRDRPLRGEEE